MVGDEPDSPIAPEDIPYSFTHKHVAKRALIVAAGPLFNVLLALLIFTSGLFFAGLPSIRPIVRTVEKSSPAQAAGVEDGDIIKSINGSPVASWRDIDQAMDNNTGQPVQLTVERQGSQQTLQVTPRQMSAKNVFGDTVTYYDLGIKGYRELSAMVDEALPGTPAAEAGLRHGDRIVAIDGQPIDSWEAMEEVVTSSKGKTLRFEIRRGNKLLDVDITPVEVQEKDLIGVKHSTYRIGIRRSGISIPDEDAVTVRVGLAGAVGQGLKQTWNVIEATGYFFVKLVKRQVPTEAIGGPIRIAQMAHKEAQQGVLQLFYFIAIISVNLAVLNILPVPVLDGGHLLFFIIEAIQGRPVSIRVREAAQQVGILLLVVLMIFVFYNDITLTWFN